MALQGAFREHRLALQSLGAPVREVRLPGDLEGLAGLVMPGGESTTMTQLLLEYGLDQPLRDFGGAVWGTCAGAILLAREIAGAPQQFSLGLLDMRVRRNAYGRQRDSFEEPLSVEGLDEPFPAVFIRAPVIEEVSPGVEVLAEREGAPVLVRSGRLLASTFHPELSGDSRLHALFLTMTAGG